MYALRNVETRSDFGILDYSKRVIRVNPRGVFIVVHLLCTVSDIGVYSYICLQNLLLYVYVGFVCVKFISHS